MKTFGQQDYRKKMDRVFARTPGKTAIVNCINENEQRRYSYRKLQKMTEHIGRVLEHAGISPGERIAVLTRPLGGYGCYAPCPRLSRISGGVTGRHGAGGGADETYPVH